eukprot:gene37174-50153_t
MPPAPLPASPAAAASWHHESAEDALAKLGATAQGLSVAEAASRLTAQGPNELRAGPRVSPFQIFLRQFKSLLIWILIVAGVISGVLGEAVDAIAILAIVVLNAVIGFYQEWNAEKSIAALKQLTAPQAKVRRDGQVTSLPAAGLVTGDILLLAAGDLVAADARLLTAASLRCVESTLTGEAEAVSKQPAPLARGPDAVPLGDRTNLVFMGTSIAAGTGEAVVVATAMNTELGRIAGLLESAGAEARGKQLGTLASLAREIATGDTMRKALDAARVEIAGMPGEDLRRRALDDAASAIATLSRIPARLVQEAAERRTEGQAVWIKARAENDFAAFAPVLERAVALKREICEHVGYTDHPYDAACGSFEPDMGWARLKALYAELKSAIGPLLEAALQAPPARVDVLERSYPVEKQKAFSKAVASRMGYDFERGRLDVSTHPFCGGADNDVRITTRYDEADFAKALMGVLHETLTQAVDNAMERLRMARLHEAQRRMAETSRHQMQQLEAENRQIQEANRLKSQFLAVFSLEL